MRAGVKSPGFLNSTFRVLILLYILCLNVLWSVFFRSLDRLKWINPPLIVKYKSFLVAKNPKLAWNDCFLLTNEKKRKWDLGHFIFGISFCTQATILLNIVSLFLKTLKFLFYWVYDMKNNCLYVYIYMYTYV